MQHVMNRRGPNCVLHGETMRTISRPIANHRVGPGERAMHIPLVAAIIRKKVIDDAVKTRPVGPIVRVSGLRPGNGDMRLAIALYDSVTHSLIGACKGDLHESAVVRPRGKVAELAGLVACIRNYRVPIFEIRPPLPVQRRERAIFVF